jgi:hypothetical protein
MMSDLKESCAIYLHMASQQLIDSDDGTIDAFCHYADDVSLFEDTLQRYNTAHSNTAQPRRRHHNVIVILSCH